MTVLLLLALYLPGFPTEPPARSGIFGVGNAQAAAPGPGPVLRLSLAERVAWMKRLLENNRKELASLRARVDDPTSEYALAQAEFQGLDDLLNDRRKALRSLQQAGKKDEAGKLVNEIKNLEDNWRLARERFDLAIEERKTIQEKIAALERKIQEDEKALNRWLNLGKNEPSSPPATASKPATGSESSKKDNPPNNPATSPAPAQGPLTASASPLPATGERKIRDAREAERRTKAREAAREKAELAREADTKLQDIVTRIAALKKVVEVESKLLQTARRRAEQARQAQAALEQELAEKTRHDAPAAEQASLRGKIEAARERLNLANQEVDRLNERLAELNSELQTLNAVQDLVSKEVEKKKKEAEEAEKKLAQIENPFAPRNLLLWVVKHGPNLAAIVLCMIVLHRLVTLGSRRLVRLVARSHKRTNQEEDDRAETLAGVFRSTASLAILIGGVLMILDELDIPIAPLLGGAAVFGLALAFGAQNLIRDYFAGFMVLLEDQYGVNDYVKIGTIEGKVERITLRTTVLRDTEGVVHFIPHGTITTVSNLSHGWSACVLNIGVAYKERPDRVMDVLMGVARDLRADEKFGPLVLEEPTLQGVDRLDDSAVVIRLTLKTKPLKQWEVKREMLRRIKNRFDEVGIEIPFPHRTIYHRNADSDEQPARRAA